MSQQARIIKLIDKNEHLERVIYGLRETIKIDVEIIEEQQADIKELAEAVIEMCNVVEHVVEQSSGIKASYAEPRALAAKHLPQGKQQ